MATRSIADLPGPGRLPLIGNAHQLKPDRLHLSAEAWAERYGPLYRFDLGRRQVVVISDVDIVNEALRDRPDGFRRWREILEITEELGPVGVFSAEGDGWRSPPSTATICSATSRSSAPAPGGCTSASSRPPSMAGPSRSARRSRPSPSTSPPPSPSATT